MRSFTLIELIIVVIIVSVLATLSYVHYSAYQEKSLDNEAEANVALIIAAERVFRMELNAYYISNVENNLNNNLRLFLPKVANRKWTYSTEENAAAVPPVCCAQATRTAAPARSWRLCTNGNAPVSGTCGGNAGNCP